MKSQLPQTGTEDSLTFILDDYLEESWPRLQTGGRRYGFSASQLFRLHLLALIARSFLYLLWNRRLKRRITTAKPCNTMVTIGV